jgi:hypothetical protein
MKKSAKEKKLNSKDTNLVVEVGLEDTDAPIAVVVPEDLDPEVLKVLIKPTKKQKASHDATDYVPELERDLSDDTDLGGNF